METPTSMGRITRSRAKAASTPPPSAGKVLKSVSNSMRKKDRTALKDVTNESPVCGLAESLDKRIHPTTPCANFSPQSAPSPASNALTPVGEGVLRSQVQSLLQKISADGSNPSVVKYLSQIKSFVLSPSCFLAPTPANTPAGATESFSTSVEMVPISLIPLTEEIESKPTESILATDEQEPKSKGEEFGCLSCAESTQLAHKEKFDQTTETTSMRATMTNHRSLIFESPIIDFAKEKSNSLIDSANEKPKSSSPSASSDLEDDEASNWSVLVNVSSPQEVRTKPTACDDEEHNPALWEQRSNSSSQYEEIRDSDADHEQSEEDYSSCESKNNEECEEESEDQDLCDELLQGVGNMNISEEKGELRGLPAFAGKHIRFNYNSDDEMEEEQMINSAKSATEMRSPGVLKLKGLPTPKGKHLRFRQNATPSKEFCSDDQSDNDVIDE